MLERIHLSIVQQVEKQGSLTAAAGVLHLTQSALSHSMKKLEQQLGTDVWLREGRNLRLTQAGQYLLAVANRVLPQLVVDHQGMALAAAGGGQQHGLVDQGILMNEIEEVLEQSRVRAAEDRCCHHQDVGLLDRRKFPFHRLGQVGAPGRAGELRCELAQFDQAQFARDCVGDQVQQVLCQGGGLGRALQPAGNRD